MSFSANVKEELLNIEIENPCCLKAMAYGMLLFGRSFKLSGISMLTDNQATATMYQRLVKEVADVDVTCTVSPSGKYILSVDSLEDRAKVFATFNLTGKESSLRINRSNLTNDADDEEFCCFRAFVRGAFLSCGTICDPNKMYSLEFIVQFLRLSEDLLVLLNEMGVQAKSTQRRGVRVVYYKDSGTIEDVLTMMGATMSSIEIMGIKVLKDVRNRVNRRTNFETANITRTVAASMEQVEAIEYIEENMGFEMLSEDLKLMAMLRTENPDVSLRELGEMFDPPISRSSVNHKLTKLINIAKKHKKDNSSTDL